MIGIVVFTGVPNQPQSASRRCGRPGGSGARRRSVIGFGRTERLVPGRVHGPPPWGAP
jgi:hypothetical protein